VDEHSWRPTETYKSSIDSLVEECTKGQGQIGPRRARVGVWNANATAAHLTDQYEMNLLLQSLNDVQRATLARMLEERFVAGVHTTLRVLHEGRIEPFDDGVEGTPYDDFVGRLGGWTWPD
jgi:hypothetical protein